VACQPVIDVAAAAGFGFSAIFGPQSRASIQSETLAVINCCSNNAYDFSK